MADIIEVFEDIKDKVGDKTFYILGTLALGYGLYNFVKGSNSNGNLTTVTTVSSYPDAVTNANVIIDTLQNSIDYSEGEIREEIQGLGDELKNTLDENFEATNDYINKGFESQNKLMDENFDSIKGSISDLDKDVSGIAKKLTSTQTSGKNTKSSTATTKKTSTSYYTYQTKKGLNTSTSIVDALKAIGVNSSMSYRKKIAQANGIKNYTGTASQNISLLNLLKKGKLKKV